MDTVTSLLSVQGNCDIPDQENPCLNSTWSRYKMGNFQLGQADGRSPFLESNLSKYNSPNKLWARLQSFSSVSLWGMNGISLGNYPVSKRKTSTKSSHIWKTKSLTDFIRERWPKLVRSSQQHSCNLLFPSGHHYASHHRLFLLTS